MHLLQFAYDFKLSGAVNTIEVKITNQRNLDKFEKWVQENIMRFNKGKSKVLHFGWGNSRYVCSLGKELIDGSPAEKDLGVPVYKKLDMSQYCVHASQKANYILHQKRGSQ